MRSRSIDTWVPRSDLNGPLQQQLGGNGQRDSEVFQSCEGVWLYHPSEWRAGHFFHKSAVNLADIAQLAKGHQLLFNMETDPVKA